MANGSSFLADLSDQAARAGGPAGNPPFGYLQVEPDNQGGGQGADQPPSTDPSGQTQPGRLPRDQPPEKYIQPPLRPHADWGQPNEVQKIANGYGGVAPGPYMPQLGDVNGIVQQIGRFMPMFGSMAGAQGGMAMLNFWAHYQAALKANQMNLAKQQLEQYEVNAAKTDQTLLEEGRAYGEIFAVYGNDPKKSQQMEEELRAEAIKRNDRAMIQALNTGKDPTNKDAPFTGSVNAAYRLMAERDRQHQILQGLNSQRAKSKEAAEEPDPFGIRGGQTGGGEFYPQTSKVAQGPSPYGPAGVPPAGPDAAAPSTVGRGPQPANVPGPAEDEAGQPAPPIPTSAGGIPINDEIKKAAIGQIMGAQQQGVGKAGPMIDAAASEYRDWLSNLPGSGQGLVNNVNKLNPILGQELDQIAHNQAPLPGTQGGAAGSGWRTGWLRAMAKRVNPDWDESQYARKADFIKQMNNEEGKGYQTLRRGNNSANAAAQVLNVLNERDENGKKLFPNNLEPYQAAVQAKLAGLRIDPRWDRLFASLMQFYQESQATINQGQYRVAALKEMLDHIPMTHGPQAIRGMLQIDSNNALSAIQNEYRAWDVNVGQGKPALYNPDTEAILTGISNMNYRTGQFLDPVTRQPLPPDQIPVRLRSPAGGAAPAAKDSGGFVPNQVYTDKNGNKAKYLGNGKWQEQ
jgi:hypothetical protein